mmetsp:Transcript_20264/g.42463  ORF Transcript_20264/g.42463 Transcript_20264/m.42463 type:complete len:233 (+) Transcript_20264:107-805(+)
MRLAAPGVGGLAGGVAAVIQGGLGRAVMPGLCPTGTPRCRSGRMVIRAKPNLRRLARKLAIPPRQWISRRFGSTNLVKISTARGLVSRHLACGLSASNRPTTSSTRQVRLKCAQTATGHGKISANGTPTNQEYWLLQVLGSTAASNIPLARPRRERIASAETLPFLSFGLVGVTTEWEWRRSAPTPWTTVTGGRRSARGTDGRSRWMETLTVNAQSGGQRRRETLHASPRTS